MMKRLISIGMLCILMLFSTTVYAENSKMHIVLDAGHGGNDSGAAAVHDGTEILEKDLNLKTALYLGSFLEEYEGVTVSYTREGDTAVELLQRTMKAKDRGADLLVSLHHNAVGEIVEYDHGCTVLAGRGVYEEEMCEEEQKLACNILYELSEIGIENQGILLRQSENGSLYDNGELADYYAIIRNGLEQKVPSVLIEHAFVDSKTDYRDYLSSDDKIRRNAEADARAIARCYQLKKKGSSEILPPLTDVKEKLTLIKDENPEHNEVSYRVFYQQQEEQTKEQPETDTTEANMTKHSEHEKSFFEKMVDRIIAWIRG